MDAAGLLTLVKKTPLLNEGERKYWVEHLPTMTFTQCAKLEELLTQTIDLPFADSIVNFLQSLATKNA